MEVLVCLARAEGHVVSKKELFDSVWGGVTVTDDVLRRCIYSLRQTLGDDPDQPRYIRTLPRRGYKLVAEVSYAAAEGLGASTTSAATPAADEPSGGRAVPPAAFRRALLAASLLGVALVSSAAFDYFAGTRGAGDLSFEPVRRELLLDDGSPSPTTAVEYFNLGASYAAQRGADDLERAIEMFGRASERDPDHAGSRAGLANAYALSVSGYYRDRERLDLAIEQATIALGLEPRMAEAHKALGIAYASKGWLSSAAREYERALELRPDYLAALNNLALVQVTLGRLDQALALQKQLDATDTIRSLYLNNIGRTYRLLVDDASARRSLEDSLRIMPGFSPAASNLAIIDLIEGDMLAARRRLNEAIRMTPDDAPLLAVAGLIELAADNVDRAMQLFVASTDNSAPGTNGRAWLGIAYVHVLRGERSEAEEIFSGFYDSAADARRVRREGWFPAYNLAAIFAMTGRVDEALIELERAFSRGYVDYRLLDHIPFFATLRGDERYDAMVSELRHKVAKMRSRAQEAGTG